MAKAQNEKTALTVAGVDKAIESFKDLQKNLKADYQKCIDLINDLGRINTDQNFENFRKKFNPQQDAINDISKNMGEQLEMSEKMKEQLKKYMNTQFSG